MVDEAHLQSLDVDYAAGRGETAADYTDVMAKLDKATEVLETALRTYDHPAVLWTGGKDSTLVAHVVRELLAEHDDLAAPTFVFINHGQHFSDVEDFVVRWSKNWGFDLEIAWNKDSALYGTPGTDVRVSDLTERNIYEVREVLDYEQETFSLSLDTRVGAHLLNTVALNDAIESGDFDALVTGVRWDEQASRGDETFFSPRHEVDAYPPHDRVQPILQFTERDVWDATWTVVVPETVEGFPINGIFPRHTDDVFDWGYDPRELPICPRYFQGYRTLGSAASTERSGDMPAWHQD